MNRESRIMEQIQKHRVQVFLGLLFVSFSLHVSLVTAQVLRSYSYDAIDYAIVINEDTTVDVTETQIYNFIGEYHQGWRNVPKKGIDDLTDVSIIDKMTGKPLTYSAVRLTKTDPTSWGKYTTFFENGEYIIEWYYSAADTKKTWELRYTLHGAISFFKDHDELYWNLFTAYQVPISKVDVDVALPSAVSSADDLKETLYVNDLVRGSHRTQHLNTNFNFYANDILPGGIITIAPGWPKGLVDPSLYKDYWWQRYWGYIVSITLFLLMPLILLLRWYFMERFRTGRGTIIPEYAPPENLPPAMAEVLVRERLTQKAWAATVIDLAVRGFLKIEEDKPEKWVTIVAGIVILVIVGIVGVYGFFIELTGLERGIFFLVFGVSIAVVFLKRMKKGGRFGEIFLPKDYILRRQPKESTGLQDYEARFLDILFPGDRMNFFTRAMRRDPVAGQAFHKKMEKLKEALLHETAQDTSGYERDFRAWKYVKIFLFLGAIAVGVSLAVFFGELSSGTFFLVVALYAFLLIGLFVHYNPRLNKRGQILRESWLGFFLYLKTAERYRLQNLTPETFEKYLPYAIIFGLEKKWAKAFAGLAVPSPDWYVGAGVGSSTSFGSSVGGFSASSFASSFSASFSSSFSSAGGGGASGGGGGAGGGGGGGGGGAS